MVNKYNRKKFEFGGGAGIARDKKMSALPEAKQLLKGLKVPNVNSTFDKEKAKKVLDQEKSGPINPKQNVTKGPMKAIPAGVFSVVRGAMGRRARKDINKYNRIIKDASKFAKENPKKVKKALNDKERIADLTKKLQKLRKK